MVIGLLRLAYVQPDFVASHGIACQWLLGLSAQYKSSKHTSQVRRVVWY
jgi:hypothetical protein